MKAEEVLQLTEVNLFMKHCGIKSRQSFDGSFETYINMEDVHRNPYGYLHGGIILTLADVAAGMNARRYIEHPVTLNSNINFLSNTDKGEICAICDVVKAGKNIVVIAVRVCSDTGLLLAQGSISFFNNTHIRYTNNLAEGEYDK